LGLATQEEAQRRDCHGNVIALTSESDVGSVNY
jgi:hypothetical protein